MPEPLKAGWHRLVAGDGLVAGMLVASDGRIVELVQVGRVPAPRRRTRRYVGTPQQVAARAERRRVEALERQLETFSALRRGTAAS